MPGVPGRGGPVPKRSDQRRRRNKTDVPIESAPATPPAVTAPSPIPPASPHWNELARDWYDSLVKSGQSIWYQPSDWQTARLIAEAMHRMLDGRFSAVAFQAVMSAMSSLLVTEGDRRRLRIELERTKPVDPDAIVSDQAVDEWLRSLTS